MAKTLSEFRGMCSPLKEPLVLSDIDRGPVVFLHRTFGGRWIRTSRGDIVSAGEFTRIFTFARRAKRKSEARQSRMRICSRVRSISATHMGDVRIGCTLVSWNELEWANYALKKGA